jgi:ribose transport system substrate-binding protein
MNKKKLIIDTLIMIAAFSVFAVWYNNKESSKLTTSQRILSSYKIYLITMDKTDQHWYFINQGASDMAALMGVNYQWEAPEVKNTEEQIEIINKAVEDGADAIMIAVIDPVLTTSAIEDAKAKAVKIIYVDSPANEEAVVTLATDNYSTGITAGNAMLNEFSELGITSGSIGIIGVNTAINSTMNRELGFRDAMNADGRFTLLDTVYENGDPAASEAAATDFITNHDDLTGLFGTNEGSTEGVGNAIKASGKNITGIGFDRSAQILELIRNGSLKAVLVQNPYTMGYLGMAETIAALQGRDTGPSYINTGISMLTRTSAR